MMLTGESNEPLEGCWGKTLNRFFPSKEMSAGCSLSRRWKLCSDSPVEKRIQLTLSAQWSLQKPWDGGLGESEDRIAPSDAHLDTDEAMAVAK